MHNLTAMQDAMLTVASKHHHDAGYYAAQSAHQFGAIGHQGPMAVLFVIAIIALVVIGLKTAFSRGA